MFYSIFWHAYRFWVVGVNTHSRLPTQKTSINLIGLLGRNTYFCASLQIIYRRTSHYLKERPLNLWQKKSLFLHSSTKTRLSKDSMAKQSSSTPKKSEIRSRSRVTRARSRVKSPSPTSSGASESRADCSSLHSTTKPSKVLVCRPFSIPQFLNHPSRCSVLLIPCASADHII